MDETTGTHKVTLIGRIEVVRYVYGEYSDIAIVDETGYKRLLAGAIRDFTINYGRHVNLRYYTSKHPLKSLSHAQTVFMTKLFGGLDVDFSAQEVGYSDITNWMEYTTELRIGGHDLFKELSEQDGGYIVLEITDEPAPDATPAPVVKKTKAGKKSRVA